MSRLPQRKEAKTGRYKIGDTVRADTFWADEEFPNVSGVVTELRHGGNVVVFETTEGRSPRSLHVDYLL